MYKTENYRYVLDTTKPARKFECPNPNCRRKSFKRYVDTFTGKFVAPECGICDHVNSCGYYLPPRVYFRDHPSERNGSTPVFVPSRLRVESKPAEQGYIPEEYCTQSMSHDSQFMRWMHSRFPDNPSRLLLLQSLYQLGGNGRGAVVFWQRNIDGRLFTGKRMYYGADGHRTGFPCFVHTSVAKRHPHLKDKEFRQCLFGEHLLRRFPDKAVILVEGEKTAIYCSMLYPDYLWLATGGCGGFSEEKLRPLRGRKLIIMPDSGVLRKWLKNAAGIDWLKCTFDSRLEKFPGNTDLVDVLLGNYPDITTDKDLQIKW